MKREFGIRERQLENEQLTFIPFTAATRAGGVNGRDGEIRKGAAEAIRAYVEKAGGRFSEVPQRHRPRREARRTPLVVAKNGRVLGVICLKDIIKDGVKEKFADLRKMGIKTIMITGDNPVTATAIAAEAGVDDFLAEATPEAKLSLIREYQAKGHLVAMTGDGSNDAPRSLRPTSRWRWYRHTGGEGGRQYGGPRLFADKADRDRPYRETTADDPRRADDLLHRQRPREILRDHPRALRRAFPAASGAEYHEAPQPRERHLLGGDL
ncbi:MAG: HAD-IC family P-type ATPase [Cloacibacillus evryensis]